MDRPETQPTEADLGPPDDEQRVATEAFARNAATHEATPVDESPPPAETGETHLEALPEAPAEEDTVEPAGRKRRHQRFEWVILVAVSLAVALIVRAFLIQAFYIPSESMLPTLRKNDRVLVNKLAYRLHDVHRGDIIVFHAPPGAGTDGVKDLIKRVIGLPGETIEGRGGVIYIDGKPLNEPYLAPDVRSREFPPEKVPRHRFWVLGDNRQDSKDSTFFKSIDEDTIVGRAFVRIWPLGDIGLL